VVDLGALVEPDSITATIQGGNVAPTMTDDELASHQAALAAQADFAERTAAAVIRLDPAAQKPFLDAVGTSLVAPTNQSVIGQLWLVFVGGLAVALLVALIGGIILALDGKGTAVATAAFTGILAGLIGVFTPSPATKS
jgi:hypothetical protein